jgi:hypothetical protein
VSGFLLYFISNIINILYADRDVWETMFGFDLCKSLTWHIFETPPTKVYVYIIALSCLRYILTLSSSRLEIGCGKCRTPNLT